MCYKGHDSPRSKSGACKQCALEYNRARRSPNGGQMLPIRESYDVINAIRTIIGLDEISHEA